MPSCLCAGYERSVMALNDQANQSNTAQNVHQPLQQHLQHNRFLSAAHKYLFSVTKFTTQNPRTESVLLYGTASAYNANGTTNSSSTAPWTAGWSVYVGGMGPSSISANLRVKDASPTTSSSKAS